MLQDFRRRTTPDTGAGRLAALRAAMAAEGVDAFLVPRSDAHQGENVAGRDERLAWLTGFTGSAGFAVVTRDKAGFSSTAATGCRCAPRWTWRRSSCRPARRQGRRHAGRSAAGRRLRRVRPLAHTAAEIVTLTEALEPRGR